MGDELLVLTEFVWAVLVHVLVPAFAGYGAGTAISQVAFFVLERFEGRAQ